MSTVKPRKRKRVTLECDAGGDREDVFVAGTFNNWNPQRKRMKPVAGKGSRSYRATLVLPRGKHEYKFVVDGEWKIDQKNPEWALNNLGTLNSVLTV